MAEPLANDKHVYKRETHGVAVRVRPRFLEAESDPRTNEYVWAYDVEIENRSDQAVRLTTRHWHIVDAAGRRQTIDGEGVVGQQPRLEPGEAFRYTSGAPLAAPSGVMGGSYDFETDLGQQLKVGIPTFSLDSPYDTSKPS